MAVPPFTGTADPPRCPIHHVSSDQCPPLDPDLGDLLPIFASLGVDITVGTQLTRLEPCTVCAEKPDGWQHQPVCVLAHRAPSEALPDGFIYLESMCAEHLWAAVSMNRRRGSKVWIEIPGPRTELAPAHAERSAAGWSQIPESWWGA